MRTSNIRPSRVRHQSDIITSKKPQAKDVYRQTLIDENVADLYESVEGNIDYDVQYVNPVAPKQRIYLAHDQQESPLPIIQPVTQTSQDISEDTVSNTAQGTTTSSTDQTALSLPDISTTPKPTEASIELDKMFDQVANELSQSQLQTVGSKHLYTFLPRQCDSLSYNYVKDDFNPVEHKHRTDMEFEDTLVTFIIHRASRPSVKLQEIECLGRQTLSDVRDAIFCLSDFASHQKRVESEGGSLDPLQGRKSACMIYLDHVFYLDARNHDYPYQAWIDKWLTKKKVNRQKFKYTTVNMQDITLGQMSLKLNTPIALMHEGQCEHMMLVPDIRLLATNEYKSLDEFPRTTHNFTYIRFKCSMCTVYPATKITHDDIVSGFSPCYFCDICFDSFHKNDQIQFTAYNGMPGGEQYRSQQKSANKTS
ncbi:snRNA-activating protein of 50kDa MW C terminal-domain-containing protein [Blakeslea trispora]|nr:snRNA-activating protein of 50kDa MW C terminal-domain-containing protein [Blakeslea trispora]